MRSLEDRVAALPRWARERMAQLELDLEVAKDELDVVTPGRRIPGDTPAVLVDYVDGDRALPGRGHVRWHPGEDPSHPRSSWYVEAYLDEGRRAVVVRGSVGIVVQPSAANSITVRLAEL